MKKKIKLIVEQIEAAENTSAFKPAQQIQHVKFALNGAVNLLSEMAVRIEALEAKSE
tara:strand:+ start:240 stop:410 length:171 start_codon:yes stop_codon:yes gene_type:complete